MKEKSMTQSRKASTVGIALGALALIGSANAQGPGWTANSTVVRLVNTSNGGVNVRLSPDVVGCTSQSGYGPNYASIYPDHQGINRIKADLLYAYATGTPVSLYLDDSTCKVMEVILGGG